MTSLTPFEVAGWFYVNNPGYSVHKGRVYLQGQVVVDPPGSQTILSGLPNPPAADTAVTMIADIGSTPDAIDRSLEIPLTYSATVTAGGDLVLDLPLPPPVAATPGGVKLVSGSLVPRYTDPLELMLDLGGVSWPVAGLLDTFASQPFGSFLDTDFTDVDSQYSIHENRLHLSGRVRAVADGAVSLTASLPGGAAPVSDGSGNFGVTQGLAPEGPRTIYLDSSHLTIPTDPPFDVASAWQTFTPDGISFPGLLGSRPGVLPSPDFQVDDLFQEGNPTFQGGFGECPYYLPNHTTVAGNVICGPLYVDVSEAETGSVDALLANYDPQPDWFILTASLQTGAGAGMIDCADRLDGGGCGPSERVLGDLSITATGSTLLASDGTAAVKVYDFPGATDDSANAAALGASGDLAVGSIYVFVAPTSPSYDKDPLNPNHILLWKRGEVSEVSFNWEAAGGGVGAFWSLGLVPYWERRDQYLRAGELFDLTGAGWELAFTPGAKEPTTVTAGIPEGGLIRRDRGTLRRVGHFGGNVAT